MDYLDVVRVKRDLAHTTADGTESVKAGDTGTIVMVYDERVGDIPKPGESIDFEVEFTDDVGNTTALMTISEDDLELVEEYKPTADNPLITRAQIEEIKRKVRALEEKK